MENFKKIFPKALICGFVLAALASFFPFAASSERLPESVIRLHVVANSDSAEDQEIKLKVRDAVLKEASKWYSGAQSMEEANSVLCTHLESINEAAEKVLRENGKEAEVISTVTDMYFDTRDYGDFTLPAGKYRTLCITLGEGEGKNWWCVVFPALCLPACTDAPDILTETDLKAFSDKAEIKFKVVEIYEGIRKWLAER